MILPTPQHLAWQRAEYGMFCHFGINTFYGKEWSDGSLDPGGFNPTQLNVQQWVTTAKAAGMNYLIFTAKHHDGFCLWPTKTTNYSVLSSTCRRDIVGELAAACAESKLPFGLYLSPWDRHEPRYSDPEAYDDFYIEQLTELLSQYGPLFEIWFDGAGSVGRTYNWERIMAVVNHYQPEAMIFNMGRPTIRWVGNEDGLAAELNPYVVDKIDGTGEYTERYLNTPRYLPPECDVSLRRGWFWHPQQTPTVKSLEHLLGIYYRSVGLGANLLLNVPPNREGLIDPVDAERLIELRYALDSRFSAPIVGNLSQQNQVITVHFDQPVSFDHIVLKEHLEQGQHVFNHKIHDGSGRLLTEGKTIGQKRIHLFPKITTEQIAITLDNADARLENVQFFLSGYERIPELGAAFTDAATSAEID